MAKILITGGAGFIGFHLAKSLAAFNNELTIIDNLSRGIVDPEFNDLLNHDNVSFQKTDLTDQNELKKLDTDFDYAYHLAAVNGTRYFYEMPQKLLKINILSTLNFLEWITKTQCKNILFSSSSEVYAGAISHYHDVVPTSEEVPLCINDVFNPRFSYGGSKIIGELLVINYARTFNISAKIVRFHNIYGPRMGYEHVIPEFCKRINKKENPFKIFGGAETRSFCYVSDAITACKLIMEKTDDQIEIFHVGNEKEEISIESLAHRLFDISGFHPELQIESAPAGSVMRRCPNTTKLKNLLNYEPKITINEGLKITYDWYNTDFKN